MFATPTKTMKKVQMDLYTIIWIEEDPQFELVLDLLVTMQTGKAL